MTRLLLFNQTVCLPSSLVTSLTFPPHVSPPLLSPAWRLQRWRPVVPEIRVSARQCRFTQIDAARGSPLHYTLYSFVPRGLTGFPPSFFLTKCILWKLLRLPKVLHSSRSSFPAYVRRFWMKAKNVTSCPCAFKKAAAETRRRRVASCVRPPAPAPPAILGVVPPVWCVNKSKTNNDPEQTPHSKNNFKARRVVSTQNMANLHTGKISPQPPSSVCCDLGQI